MTEVVEDTENLMPTERKSFWRSAEERRMSDLTRVLEWLERRQGKKRALQKKKEETKSTEEKAGKKNVGAKKKLEKVSRKVTFHKGYVRPVKKKEPTIYHKRNEIDLKSKRLSMITANFRDSNKKSGQSGSRRTSESTGKHRHQGCYSPRNQQSGKRFPKTKLCRSWNSGRYVWQPEGRHPERMGKQGSRQQL
ncbi:RIKEN cDNA 4933402J07 [Mus musculus]|nr:RIKEN cDNA 4933402J07 [Mus musculus]